MKLMLAATLFLFLAGCVQPKQSPMKEISRTATAQPDKSNKSSESCYDIGYKYGHAAALAMFGFKVPPEDDITLPTECRYQEATRLGIKAGTTAAYREHGVPTE